MGLVSFVGGIFPPHAKSATESLAIEDFPTPSTVEIPARQHIGAPCNVIVKKGDEIKVGQVIAEAGGFVSASIHSSVSGKVKDIKTKNTPYGIDKVVIIENDGHFAVSDSVVKPPDYKTLGRDEIVNIIKNAGIVGMGGAAFPTHVKLSPPPDKPIDYILLNGAECEPYLTCDHRLMLESPELIVKGLSIIMHALSVKNGVIGIEGNKPDAIAKMEQTANGDGIKVLGLKAKYPQGAEKQLIYACTGRQVPSGGLPMDIGVVVVNVATAAKIADLFNSGMPLIERICTVTGSVNEPKNLRFRIGVKISELIEYCGGYSKEPGKIILGGPMMGVAQFSEDMQALKNTSGVLVLSKEKATIPDETPCIRCGRCLSACPIRLVPVSIADNSRQNRFEEAAKYNAMDCIECGSCSFICPAKRPLLQAIRVAKKQIIAERGKNGK